MFKSVYQRTGFYFAFALSLTYLPLWLGVGDAYGICCSPVMTVVIGTVAFTAANYLYIVSVERFKAKFLTPILLPIANIALMFYLAFSRLFLVEGNVFAFSMIFLFAPWIVLSVSSWRKHIDALE